MPDIPNIDLLLCVQAEESHLRGVGLTLAKGHVHSYLATIESQGARFGDAWITESLTADRCPPKLQFWAQTTSIRESRRAT